MNRITLLEQLCTITKDETADIILPVRLQKNEKGNLFRAAEVYSMRLPDSKAAKQKAPYIIHQLITSKDIQPLGNEVSSTALIRSIFCVYSDDEQEGSLMLLNLMERLRIRLLRQVVIGNQYQLDLETGLEAILYPEDTAPYFAGEMVSGWKLPNIQREVNETWQ